jgi:hypothetical protein
MQMGVLNVAATMHPRRPWAVIAMHFAICSKAPHGAAHGKAQIAIHSPIASHGTGVVNVHNEEKAM